MLSIRLEESDCFSAWIMGSDARLDESVSELKCEWHSWLVLNLTATTLFFSEPRSSGAACSL